MEQRRTQRFSLQLPVEIRRSGPQRVTAKGFTKNISSMGVLFTSDRQPDVGAPIEYVVTLSRNCSNEVCIRCIGKVLRAERLSGEAGASFQVAATLERYEFVRENEMNGVNGESSH